ncbi:hypothetical protein [Methylocella sp.]|uniref:hypothetical protein n=1 Tax=Methylocella sp. TaxID=1978226 RepID=UPI0035B3DBBE
MTMRSDDPRRTSDEPPEVLTPIEARQGSRNQMTRYVLRYGLILVVIAFLVIYFTHR